MTAVTKIATAEEHEAALDRFEAAMHRTDFTADEIVEYRALADAIHDYQKEHILPKDVVLDPAIYFDVRLDSGFSTLDELVPLFGGMDAIIEFMTRRRPLSDEMIDHLTAALRIGRDSIDGPFTEPEGWDLMEDCTDGMDWRAELIAYRDAKAAEINRDRQDVQDRGRAVSVAVG